MSEPTPSRANPFWDFSLKLYASPAVQRACLELQDESGVDVNVLLYMLWQASRGHRLTDDDARAVLAVVEPWRADVVVPLRTARRNLKSPPAGLDARGAEALRSIVKKAELEAERLQQAALFAFEPPSAPHSSNSGGRPTGEANAAAYAKALGRPLATAPLGVMLSALVELMAA
jgi:uncharacterized protein (TIGR02444 family)